MQLRTLLRGHGGHVLCTRFGPNGRRVVTGGRDKAIIIWSLSGKLEHRLDGHTKRVNVLTFLPSGELVSGGGDGTIRLWSWPRGRAIKCIEAHRAQIYSLGCSADGRLIASGSADETICVWERDSGELRHRLEVGPRGMSFVFSADGEHLVSGRGGDTLCFWSLETGELVWEQQAGPGMVGALELDNGGEWAISRGYGGPVTLWDTRQWSYASVLPIIERKLGAVVLRPQHSQLVCVWAGAIGLFDRESGWEVARAEIPSNGVYGLDVSRDGCLAVTASADNIARLWTL